MQKRNFIKAVFSTSSLILALPALARAQTSLSMDQVLLSNNIENNHGHSFRLSQIDALKILRATQSGQNELINIKGSSGHNHQIELAHEDLLNLFILGQIQKSSTEDAGHSHKVIIKLQII